MKLNSVISIMSILALGSCKSQEKSEPLKPNIIYILADDMGYHELGCYGQEVIETPNIDQLAKEGMMFTNHYTGSNICAPSRCALLTGKHSGHGWIRDNRPLPFEGNEPIPDEEITIAEILKMKNYATGVFGKWGLGYPLSEGSPNKQGFDQFYGYNCQRHAHNYFSTYMRQNVDSVTLSGNLEKPYTDYSADVIHNKALEFIETNKTKPFFLYYATTLPHSPYNQPDGELLEYYKIKTGLPKGDAAEEDFSVPKYAAMTARLDMHVGEIIAKLKEMDLLDNTLIIFSSDNGTALRPNEDSYLQTGGKLHGRKGEVYEGGIKAPMIAVWKGKILPGTVSNHISAFWDVLPTLAELVNTDNPENIDGISFLPTLLGNQEEQKDHEYLYWERNQSQAIRKGDMKAIISYDKKTYQQSVEIYNIADDPFEEKNMAENLPELKQSFLELAKSARIESELFPLLKISKN
ncbi:MAG: arylsulfatase [Bacteroidales bacterium]|nr:arylsulfatase [Bacteroidales bacterium]MCF8389340.1 arylsulfatase [Bacteroidales bacterium]